VIVGQFREDGTQIQGNGVRAVLVPASWAFGLQVLDLKVLEGEELVSVSQACQRTFSSRGRLSTDTAPSPCARGENEYQGLALLEREGHTSLHTRLHPLAKDR